MLYFIHTKSRMLEKNETVIFRHFRFRRNFCFDFAWGRPLLLPVLCPVDVTLEGVGLHFPYVIQGKFQSRAQGHFGSLSLWDSGFNCA